MENINFKNKRSFLNNIEKIILIGGPISYFITKVYLHFFYFKIGASLQIIESDKHVMINFLLTFSVFVLFGILMKKIDESTWRKARRVLSIDEKSQNKKSIAERIIQSIYTSNYGVFFLFTLTFLSKISSFKLKVISALIMILSVFLNYRSIIKIMIKIDDKEENKLFKILLITFYCIVVLLIITFRNNGYVIIVFYCLLIQISLASVFYCVFLSLEEVKSLEVDTTYTLNLKSLSVFFLIAVVILPGSIGYMHASLALPGMRVFSKYNILLAENDEKYLILKNTDNYFLVTELKCSEDNNEIKCSQKIDTSMLRYVEKTEYPIMKTTVNWLDE